MTRYPPWDAKAALRICARCPYCINDEPDAACGCLCHEEDDED